MIEQKKFTEINIFAKLRMIKHYEEQGYKFLWEKLDLVGVEEWLYTVIMVREKSERQT